MVVLRSSPVSWPLPICVGMRLAGFCEKGDRPVSRQGGAMVVAETVSLLEIVSWSTTGARCRECVLALCFETEYLKVAIRSEVNVRSLKKLRR